jgi:hypothetical protein
MHAFASSLRPSVHTLAAPAMTDAKRMPEMPDAPRACFKKNG